MHSKKVKMMFRTPDKIGSVRSLMNSTNTKNDSSWSSNSRHNNSRNSRAEKTSNVKGYSYDNNMGVVQERSANAKRKANKWVVDKSVLGQGKRPKRKTQIVVRKEFGLFD